MKNEIIGPISGFSFFTGISEKGRPFYKFEYNRKKSKDSKEYEKTEFFVYPEQLVSMKTVVCRTVDKMIIMESAHATALMESRIAEKNGGGVSEDKPF